MVGAYQFGVTCDIEYNFAIIQKDIKETEEEGIKLLVFPECALTGKSILKRNI